MNALPGAAGDADCMLKRELVTAGKLYVIVALCTREGDLTLFDQFVESLPEAGQKKIHAAAERMCNQGPPRNLEKGRPIKGQNNLFELKEYQSRVFWFRAGKLPDGRGLIVLTHGFTKKTDKTPQAQIDRAVALKKQYLATYPGE
jgi:phage-related protein